MAYDVSALLTENDTLIKIKSYFKNGESHG